MPRYEFLEEIVSQGSATNGYRKTEKLEPDYNVRSLQLRGSYNINITNLVPAPVLIGQFHPMDIMDDWKLELNRNVPMRTMAAMRHSRLFDRILSGGPTPSSQPAALALGDNLFTWTLNVPMGFHGTTVKNPEFGWLIRKLMTLFKTTLRFGIGANIFATAPTAYTLQDCKVEIWSQMEPIIKYAGAGQKYTTRVEEWDQQDFTSAVGAYRIKLQPYAKKIKGILIVAEDDGVNGGLTDDLVATVKLNLNGNPLLNETPWDTLQIDNKDVFSPQGIAITTGAVYYELSPGNLVDLIDLENVSTCHLILGIDAPVGIGTVTTYLVAKP